MNEFELRRRLRDAGGGLSPRRDLWPGIAAGLDGEAARPQAPAMPVRRGGRWLQAPWLALAAALVLGVVLMWRVDPLGRPVPVAGSDVGTNAGMSAGTNVPADMAAAPAVEAPATSLLQREAQAMTLEYLAALQALGAEAVPSEAAPGLAELDASAAQIRAAIEQDSQAVFLVERLRGTYDQRLRLTQRVLAG